MSKPKIKKHTSGVKKNNVLPKKEKNKRPKAPWIKLKDFKFMKPIKFLPGFRTAKHWKRIVAMTYFCITPFSLAFKFGEFRFFGIYLFIALLIAPFLICSLATFAKTKDRFYAIETLIAALLFGADNIFLMHFMRNIIQNLPK